MNDIPKSIFIELEKLDALRVKLLGYTPTAKLCDDLAEKYKDQWPAGNSYSPNIAVSIGVQFGSLEGVLIMIHTTDMAVVTPILRELRAAGYKIKGHSDYAEIGRRTYDMGDIQVSVFVPTGSEAPGAKCSYVQTGTKEVPVYELKCSPEIPVEMP